MSDSKAATPTAESSREERIKDLEAQVSAKDAELNAKTKSYEDTIAKEQTKQREREEHHSAKRDEQSQEILKLTEERSNMKEKLKKLQVFEAECEVVKSQLADKKKENAKMRAQHSDEKTNLQFQLDDRRHVADKQQQEVSDLRCQISIFEHKLGHATNKQSAAEAQMEELSKLQLQVQTLNERISTNDRVHNTEAVRAQRERRSLEERVAKLTSELNSERMPPTKTQVVERYETILQSKHDLLHAAIQLATRPGGPLPPLRGAETDAETVQAFLDKMKVYLAQTEQQARQAAHGDRPSSGGSSKKSRESEYKKLNESLDKVPQATRQKLVKRFEDCAQANIASSRRFGDTSGFPDQASEDPAVLVNHIANLTVQRDQLQTLADDLNFRLARAEKNGAGAGSSSVRRTHSGSVSAGSPGGASSTKSPAGSPQIIKVAVAAPSYRSSSPKRSPSPTSPGSAKKRLNMR